MFLLFHTQQLPRLKDRCCRHWFRRT